jgi:hypothetical protein
MDINKTQQKKWQKDNEVFERPGESGCPAVRACSIRFLSVQSKGRRCFPTSSLRCEEALRNLGFEIPDGTVF